jgi:hypothetical protein
MLLWLIELPISAPFHRVKWSKRDAAEGAAIH